MLLYGLYGIYGAAGRVAAGGGKIGGNAVLVYPNQQNHGEAGCLAQSAA